MTGPPTIWAGLAGVELTQRWIDAGGVRTRVVEVGRGHAGTPLVLLHGTGGHAETYARNLAAHADRLHTYAIDLVGHGWSDRPAIDYEVDAYVDHVLAFLDAVGAERAHLSGQSLGGWVGARLAARHPDRVARLVLNTAGGFTLDREVMAEARRLSRPATGEAMTADAVRARLEWLVHDPATITDEVVAIRHAIATSPGYAEHVEGVLCLQDPEVRQRNLLTEDELRSIEAETLVIWTDHDPTAGVPVGRRIAELIPHARFELVVDAAHWPQFEHPEVFDRLQLDFLVGAS